ncbi:hypothetical protein CFP71_14625 [Amycolatopsis thailandensis]|uniref:Uncharacterized protein n=1 Tax=Amycolatopsis thailandensis TaxID=589330 RepID=A0A229SAV6_9PSEU|nr:hypothetical protein CFP71_14625 [Amycolatopsis thailandensis]
MFVEAVHGDDAGVVRAVVGLPRDAFVRVLLMFDRIGERGDEPGRFGLGSLSELGSGGFAGSGFRGLWLPWRR